MSKQTTNQTNKTNLRTKKQTNNAKQIQKQQQQTND